MHIGSLCSLAEVGIGINLAFSTVHDLRERRSLRLSTDVRSAVKEIEVGLAEEKLNGEPTAIKEAYALEASFLRRTTAAESVFVVAAITSAFALFVVLVLAAFEGAIDCSYNFLIFVVAAAAAPIAGWWIELEVEFKIACRTIANIKAKHADAFRIFREFSAMQVRATDPGTSNPPLPNNNEDVTL